MTETFFKACNPELTKTFTSTCAYLDGCKNSNSPFPIKLNTVWPLSYRTSESCLSKIIHLDNIQYDTPSKGNIFIAWESAKVIGAESFKGANQLNLYFNWYLKNKKDIPWLSNLKFLFKDIKNNVLNYVRRAEIIDYLIFLKRNPPKNKFCVDFTLFWPATCFSNKDTSYNAIRKRGDCIENENFVFFDPSKHDVLDFPFVPMIGVPLLTIDLAITLCTNRILVTNRDKSKEFRSWVINIFEKELYKNDSYIASQNCPVIFEDEPAIETIIQHPCSEIIGPTTTSPYTDEIINKVKPRFSIDSFKLTTEESKPKKTKPLSNVVSITSTKSQDSSKEYYSIKEFCSLFEIPITLSNNCINSLINKAKILSKASSVNVGHTKNRSLCFTFDILRKAFIDLLTDSSIRCILLTKGRFIISISIFGNQDYKTEEYLSNTDSIIPYHFVIKAFNLDSIDKAPQNISFAYPVEESV